MSHPPPRHDPIDVGPLRFESRIGEGGMGTVWRAWHDRLGQHVAVKILRTIGYNSESTQRVFKAEVRALARLDHPAIVYVYDSGFLPYGVNAQSGGLLADNAPYVVMELAGGMSLRSARGRLEWPALRGILLTLLDALAHAHARGVLHLDLKPANVLCALDRGDVRLTDFGLARLRDVAARDTGRFEGTPAYMAPEQVQCLSRLLGPWTDLYAMGCLAYALACGDSPFRRKGGFAICEAQLHDPPPPLAAKHPVPPGFDAWIERLLNKAPRARFNAAADAAAALLALGSETLEAAPLGGLLGFDNAAPIELSGAELSDAESAASASDPFSDVDADLISVSIAALPGGLLAPPTAPAHAVTAPAPQRVPTGVGDLTDATIADLTISETGDGQVELAHAPTGSLSAPIASTGRTLLVPTIPSWIEAAADDRAEVPPLPQAPPVAQRERPPSGLGLFGLRTPPMRGRSAPCGALWRALRRCQAAGRPQAVVVRGPGGVGKSRLIEWLATAAHVGAGITTVRITLSDSPAARDALAEGFARVLRADGLEGKPLRTHLEARLGSDAATHDVEWSAWVALLTDAEMRPENRAVAADWLLRTLADRRPIILWIDDAHHGGPTLDIVERLLQQGAAPVLVAATVDDAALAENEAAQAGIAALTARGSAVDVDPLDEDDHLALVRSMVSLDDTLALAIAERTAGNPLFAVQLIRQWADDGMLEDTPAGVRLRPGVQPSRPLAIEAVWRARITRVLDSHSDEAGVALELAATLGEVVDEIELIAACDRARIDPAASLFETLFDTRLAYRADQAPTWRFGHGAVRELILERAAAAGRLKGHHRVCAMVLAGDPGSAWRVARHLLAADRPGAALVPFDQALDRALDRMDTLLARRLVTEMQVAFQRAGVGESDRRYAAWRLHRARLNRVSGDPEAAENEARLVLAQAHTQGWAATTALAVEQIAAVVLTRDPTRGIDLLERLIRLDAPGLRPAVQCRVRVMLGYQNLAVGQTDKALEWADDAADRASKLGQDELMGMARLIQAMAAPDDPNADWRLTEAEALFAGVGHRGGLAHCHNMRGERARASGDLIVAERFYRSAATLFDQSTKAQALYPRLNLALIELTQGLYLEADETLNVIAESMGSARAKPRLTVPVLRAACAAGRGDWDRCVEQLADARAAQTTKLVVDDAAQWASWVAVRADAAGRPTLAAIARQIAADAGHERASDLPSTPKQAKPGETTSPGAIDEVTIPDR